MSALSMQYFSPANPRYSVIRSDRAAPLPTITDVLIAASRIRPGERVKIIGPNAAAHLIGLVRTGCASATSALPELLHFQREAAEVVWITGVDDVETRMATIMPDLGRPRVVAVELLKASAADRLLPFVRRLVNHATVACAAHESGSLVFVASRPSRLQRAA